MTSSGTSAFRTPPLSLMALIRLQQKLRAVPSTQPSHTLQWGPLWGDAEKPPWEMCCDCITAPRHVALVLHTAMQQCHLLEQPHAHQHPDLSSAPNQTFGTRMGADPTVGPSWLPTVRSSTDVHPGATRLQ